MAFGDAAFFASITSPCGARKARFLQAR